MRTYEARSIHRVDKMQSIFYVKIFVGICSNHSAWKYWEVRKSQVKCWRQMLIRVNVFKGFADISNVTKIRRSRNRTPDYKYSRSINLDSLSILFHDICYRVFLVSFRVFMMGSLPKTELGRMWEGAVVYGTLIWSRSTSRHLSGGLRKATITLVSESGFELWTSKLQRKSANVRKIPCCYLHRAKLDVTDIHTRIEIGTRDPIVRVAGRYIQFQPESLISPSRFEVVNFRIHTCVNLLSSEPVQSTLRSSGYDVCHRLGRTCCLHHQGNLTQFRFCITVSHSVLVFHPTAVWSVLLLRMREVRLPILNWRWDVEVLCDFP